MPFFRRSVGTGDRGKLLCTLLPPQRGHRGQEQTSLYPSSASTWAQEIESSFSVPILPPQRDIVNIGLHFFLKDVRPMLPPVMNRSIVDA